LWAVDAEDRTIDVNPALLAALGYTREEMIGQSPGKFLTAESREKYRAQSILRLAGMADTFEVTFITKDGSHRTLLVNGSPVFRDGDYIGKIAVFRDMSAWRAHVRHELATPLNSILGFSGLLLRGAPGSLTEEQRKQLELIQGSAQKMLELLDRRLGEAASPGGSAVRP
jgi:PAS domain S-box-containing protein